MSDAKWVPWDPSKVAPAVRRVGPHVMSKGFKRLPWRYCAHCGLMNLKNESTRKALKRPCVTEE